MRSVTEVICAKRTATSVYQTVLSIKKLPIIKDRLNYLI